MRAGEIETVYEIVGVVRDTKYRTLREDFAPTAFLPLGQGKDFEDDYVVRTHLPIAGVVGSLKQSVLGQYPSLRVDIDLLDRPGAARPAQYRPIHGLDGGVAVCASLFPARRAARVDPMVALREE